MISDTRTITPAAGPLCGGIAVPGDKSISHRCVMLGSLAFGKTRIRHFLNGADCLHTIGCFRQMGIEIEEQDGDGGKEIIVTGKGLHGLLPPAGLLDAGNSGTTMRLMAGILAGQPFESTIDGDSSLRRRPMNRVITPLSMMGAKIESQEGNGCAPLCIRPEKLHGIRYESPVASAQVKSSVLLAGLYADSPVTVTEPALSRDHTERMLGACGARITTEGRAVTVYPDPVLNALDVTVPGDISSAAYFIAAALVVPGSELLIKNVGINPTRDGFLRAVLEMGADITLLNRTDEGNEPTADLLVRYSPLEGVTVSGDMIPTLIDELPILAVLGAYAEGETVIADAAELKVKESDRIAVMTGNLRRMGADVTPTDDGMIIRGGKTLSGAVIDSCLDHRVAMSFAVAALGARGETAVTGAACVQISYPGFFEELGRL